MADSGDRTTTRTNRYNKPNRYETRPPPDRGSLTPPAAPKVELTVNTDAWRPRNGGAAATYTPLLGEGSQGRRNAQRLMKDIGTATAVANAGTHLNASLKKLEESQQELEETQERRRLIPLKVEQTKLQMGRDVVLAQTAFEEVLDEQQDKCVDRQRERELASQDFEFVRLQNEQKIIEAQARIDEANARRSYGPDIRRQQGEAELQRYRRDTLRNEADAEVERSRRDRERRPPAAMDDVPDDLQGPLATERTVANTRQWVDGKIAQIKRRARDANRELTPDEAEQIEHLLDAADAGEASIRRRGASDL